MKETTLDEQTRVPIGWLYGIGVSLLGAVFMVGTYAVSLTAWKTTTDLRIENLEKNTALQEQQLKALHEMNNRLANIEGQLSVINSRGAAQARRSKNNE
jgi:hypothetical protein